MDEFSKLTYRELQQIAKTAGVKANLPKAEILKALRDNAADGSFLTDDEDPPIQEIVPSGKKDRKSESKLNTTFDKEDSSANDEPLNVTFDKEEDNIKEKRRSSVRLLSVDTLLKENVAKETENSPALRKSSCKAKGPESVIVPTPKRKSIGAGAKRVSELKERSKTPRTSLSGKIVKPGTPKCATPRGIASVKKPTPGSKKKTLPGTNIPRFMKYARKVPDFSKLHEQQFKKMESLDQVMEKKNKRIESNVEDQRIQKAKVLGDEHLKLMEKMKARAFAPTSVTSTSKLNFNFGGRSTPNKNEPFKFSAAQSTVTESMKKPVRSQVDVKTSTKSTASTGVASKKARIVKPVTVKKPEPVRNNFTKPKLDTKILHAKKIEKPQGSAVKSARTPALTRAGKNKKVEITPSRGTPRNNTVLRTPASAALNNITNRSVNLATPSSARKQAFNLKQSLAKPLGYKPHTGKLPTWGDKKVTDMRSVAAKDVIERTRNIIKGVRMNKRAALMMQNRNMEEDN